MKRTLLVALAISVSIGSQVNLRAASPTGSTKLGSLSFALTDTIQGPSSKGVRYNIAPFPAVTNTVPDLLLCNGSFKYVSSVAKVDNAAVLRAISSALTGSDYKQVGGSGNGVFTSRAVLAIWNYDNVLPGPPYPPYLPESTGVLGPADTFNGPRLPKVDTTVTPPTVDNTSVENVVVGYPATWEWPNLHQIDWVDYDGLASRNADSTLDPTGSLWPKAQVFVSDPGNGNPLFTCVNVTPFFSFEEAYCYFCWDTVDRVSDGTFATGTTGEICIGSSCGTTGKATTRWYMTIKFDNKNSLAAPIVYNSWLDKYGPGLVAGVGDIIAPWLPPYLLDNVPYTYPYLDTGGVLRKQMSVEAWLSFSVGGVVVYPWQITTLQGVAAPFGTMTMATANGFASNPWCGVLTGSVKITERTDYGNPICVDTANWPPPND